MSSSTLWTSVPRTASGDDGSGSRSTVRNRYISGQLRKSAARLGESDPTIRGSSCCAVAMPPSVGGGTDVGGRD